MTVTVPHEWIVAAEARNTYANLLFERRRHGTTLRPLQIAWLRTPVSVNRGLRPLR